MTIFRRALILAAFAATFAVPSGRAHAFGDVPDNYFDPAVDVGCWRWNWQQHAFYDVCPVYVHPKAYMYPRRAHAVLRTKG
jgi:hypothetical protein